MTSEERRRLKRLKEKVDKLRQENQTKKKIIKSFESGEMIIGEKYENRDTNEATKS